MTPLTRYRGTIGQTLFVGDGRLVDTTGKGIPGGWFFVDKDGNRLSQDFTTDANGAFHWDIDDTNAAIVFLNFYSTPDFAPVVLTPAELIANSTVTLINKNIGTGALPWVLGAGVVGLLLIGSTRKKIGASLVERARGKYKSLSPTTQKIILYGTGGIAAYFLIKYFFGYKPTEQQTAEIQAATDVLKRLAAEQGIVPTMNDSQFNEMVNVIRTAVDDCGTDNDAIYSQFEKLNNEADIYKLIATYKVQAYKGCFEGSYFGDVHHTLSETLHADMSSSEVDQVNAILSSKFIPYGF